SNILFTGTDKWSLDKRVTLVNTSNREFSILIDKVQVADEGPYTCTFQANNKPRITHVYLIVQVPARIVNISKSVSLNEGESVTLYCLAVGRPEPTVTWRNQKCKIFILVFLLLDPDILLENDNTLRIKNEKTRSLLLFTNVTEKHFGNYTCFASNRLGSSNASIYVIFFFVFFALQLHYNYKDIGYLALSFNESAHSQQPEKYIFFPMNQIRNRYELSHV
uniref:IgLON family member 5 n=1 Tax=Fundulus heteroclitus TaxID=8078 RepID=A0A3Q2QZY3_FUNHE